MLPAGSSGYLRSARRDTPETSQSQPLFTLHRAGFAWTGDVAATPVSSYLTFSPLPGAPLAHLPGGLFLWHFPWGGCPWSVLPTTLPCDARTFLPPECGGDPRMSVKTSRRPPKNRTAIVSTRARNRTVEQPTSPAVCSRPAGESIRPLPSLQQRRLRRRWRLPRKRGSGCNWGRPPGFHRAESR